MPNKSRKILKALRLWLLQHDKTLTQLAKDLGVSRSSIYMAIYCDAKTGRVVEWMEKEKIYMER